MLSLSRALPCPYPEIGRGDLIVSPLGSSGRRRLKTGAAVYSRAGGAASPPLKLRWSLQGAGARKMGRTGRPAWL